MANKIDVKEDQRVFNAASLMGPISGLPTTVDSDRDGKIIRIRPYYYEENQKWESLNPWKIEAKGKVFEPPKRSLPAVYYLSYKKRVYSQNRVRWPLKRVDWDPDGDRHPENRGKSKYVRISWDEATTLIAKEIKRVRDTYGMSSILAEADMHGEGKHVAPSHGCMNRLLSILGGYTVQMRNMDSWEGYAWGSKNVWGCEPVGEVQPSGNVWPDIAQNAEMLLFWAADPEVTSVGFDGYMASRLSYWLHSLGLKFVYVDPALNYSGVCQADKWIPLLPNTDAALELAIAYVWLTEGIYDKEYVATHAVGTEPFFDYVLGKAEDKTPKTPAGLQKSAGWRPGPSKPLPGVGRQDHQRHHRERRAGHPRTLCHGALPPAVHPHGNAGAVQAGPQLCQMDRVEPAHQGLRHAVSGKGAHHDSAPGGDRPSPRGHL
jgi:trimethylamine-N-oxide reductase (cytochrome c)